MLTHINISKLTAGAVLLGSMLVAPFANAADRYWVCGSDSWNISACWSATAGGAGGASVPAGMDAAYMLHSDAIDRTINYIEPVTYAIQHDPVSIDNTGSGTTTLQISQDFLNVLNFRVGIDGSGTVNHTGGTVHSGFASSVWLTTLGVNAGSVGTYNLSGTGVLDNRNTAWLVVGGNGQGFFNQSGGSNLVRGNLHIGGSGSTYSLSGGTVDVNGQVNIGQTGTGGSNFVQTGGTATFNSTLNVKTAGSQYQLQAGSLTANGTTITAGQFQQSGGTSNLGTMSGASNGQYVLTGGTTNATAIASNTYSITVNGGNLNVAVDITLGNAITLNMLSGNLAYNTLNMNAGSTVTGNVTVGASSIFNYNAGNFTNGGFAPTSTGTMNINGPLTTNSNITRNGTMNVTSVMTLSGAGLTNNNITNLNGGTISAGTQVLNNGTMSGYGTISGAGSFSNVGTF